MGVYIWAKNQKEPNNIFFLIITAITALVSFAEYKLRSASGAEEAFFWYKIMMIWPLILSFTFQFVLVYTNLRNNPILRIFNIIIHFGSIVFFILFLLSNDGSIGVTKVSWGWRTYNKLSLLTFTSSVWSVFVTVFLIILSYRHYFKTTDELLKKQSLFINIGISIFFFISILNYTLIPALNLNIPELNTTSCVIGYLFIAHSIYKYKLFILSPDEIALQLIESINEIIILTDAKGQILYSNKTSEKIFNVEPNRIKNSNIAYYLKNEDFTKENSKFDDYKTYNELYSSQGKNKNEIWLLVNRFIIRDSFKAIRGFIYFIKDITEVYELKKEKNHATFIEKAHSLFIQSLYDELTNSLSCIVQLAEQTKTNKNLNKKQEIVKSLLENTELLYKYIEKIQYIISIDNNQIHHNPEKNNLNKIIDQTEQYIREQCNVLNKNDIQTISIKLYEYKKANILIDKEITDLILKILIELIIEKTPSGTIKIGYISSEENKITIYVSSTNFQAEDYNTIHAIYELNTQDYTKIRVYGRSGVNFAIIKKLSEFCGYSIAYEYNDNAFVFYINTNTSIIY
jgi:PAS domain S-box-containing protein